MKFFGLLLTCFALLTCYSCKKTPEYVRLAYKQRGIFINKVKIEENLICYGLGGSLMYDVAKFNLSFFYFNVLMDVKEARKLIIRNVENFLNQINKDLEIRPFLHNYPFDFKNLEFRITFQDKNMKDPGKDFLVSVVLIDGKLKYTNSDGNENYGIFHVETYEEGLQIVHAEFINN